MQGHNIFIPDAPLPQWVYRDFTLFPNKEVEEERKTQNLQTRDQMQEHFKETLRMKTEGDPTDDSCAAGLKDNQSKLQSTWAFHQKSLLGDEVIGNPNVPDCADKWFTQFEEWGWITDKYI